MGRGLDSPRDLLNEQEQPHALSPFSVIPSREPVVAVTSYPGFQLHEDQLASGLTTSLCLSSVREHPIRLHSLLTSNLLASYPLVNPNTEAVIAPRSLLFTPSGTEFITGSDSLITVFDVSRPGQPPKLWFPTAPPGSRSNPMLRMKGIVSALAIEPGTSSSHGGLLAAGTFTRQVALYDSMGRGETVGVFWVKGNEADKHIRGGGVTQLLWSLCGRYLYVAERKSKGVMLYDIRNTGHILSWLVGRKAMTNQRLNLDLRSVPTDPSTAIFPPVTASTSSEAGLHEMLAGGTDGCVRIWQNPHFSQGPVHPTGVAWTAHSGTSTTRASSLHLCHPPQP